MIITDTKEIKTFIKKLTELNQLAKTLNKHSYYYIKDGTVYSDTVYSSSEPSGVSKMKLNPEFNDILEYIDNIFIDGKILYAQLKELKNPTEVIINKGQVEIKSETLDITLSKIINMGVYCRSYKPYYKKFSSIIKTVDSYESDDNDITFVMEDFNDKAIPVLVEIDNIKIRISKKLIKGLSRLSANIEPLFLKVKPLTENEFRVRLRYIKQNVKKSKKGDTIQDVAVIDSYYKIINF